LGNQTATRSKETDQRRAKTIFKCGRWTHNEIKSFQRRKSTEEKTNTNVRRRETDNKTESGSGRQPHASTEKISGQKRGRGGKRGL